jgi:chemotaxis protein CheC
VNLIELNEDERDCLQELMNVAYGSATATISEILDAFATLNVPKIQIIPATELKTYLKDKLLIKDEQFVATQILNGDISGENLFLINKSSAINLAYEFDLDNEEINDNELFDIVLEITNILSSTTIGKLAKELDTTVSFEPPSIQKIDSIDNLDNKFLEQYQQIIIISTELEFKDQKISAELLILTKDDSILWLKNALNKILDEF